MSRTSSSVANDPNARINRQVWSPATASSEPPRVMTPRCRLGTATSRSEPILLVCRRLFRSTRCRAGGGTKRRGRRTPDPADFRGQVWDTHGRPVRYPIPNAGQPALSAWLYGNPRRINLGRVGLRVRKADGNEATEADLQNPWQELDLWTGIIHSRFEIERQTVLVETACDPERDVLAFRIESPLIAQRRLTVRLAFPDDDGREFANYVGSYDHPEVHFTDASLAPEGKEVRIHRRLDETALFRACDGCGERHFHGARRPRPTRTASCCHRSEGPRLNSSAGSPPCAGDDHAPDARAVFERSAAHWPHFWNAGGAIDLRQHRPARARTGTAHRPVAIPDGGQRSRVAAAAGERAGQQRLERQVPHGDVLVARRALGAVGSLAAAGAQPERVSNASCRRAQSGRSARAIAGARWPKMHRPGTGGIAAPDSRAR